MVQPLPKHRAREYETIFIAHPDTNPEGIDQIAGRLTDSINKLEGKLLRAENWGRRRLAYPLRKQHKGIYIYLRYLGYSDLVHELERNMRMLEPVMKYLTVKLDEDVDPNARPVREEDISFVPQFEEEPSYSDGPSKPAVREADSSREADESQDEEASQEEASDSPEESQSEDAPLEDASSEDAPSEDASNEDDYPKEDSQKEDSETDDSETDDSETDDSKKEEQ